MMPAAPPDTRAPHVAYAVDLAAVRARYLGRLVTAGAVDHRVTWAIAIRSGIYLAVRCGHYLPVPALGNTAPRTSTCGVCALLELEDAAGGQGS